MKIKAGDIHFFWKPDGIQAVQLSAIATVEESWPVVLRSGGFYGFRLRSSSYGGQVASNRPYGPQILLGAVISYALYDAIWWALNK